MDEQPRPVLGEVTDRNLALELVRVTEAAALAASRWIGRGQKNEADGAAVEAMRKAFDTVAIDGTVVIGEGEMDEAPMLYIGERLGHGGPAMDIAVDPLEGTTLTAKGGPNAIATVAMAEKGGFLHAPDIYMDKIAVGGELPDGVIDLDAPVGENLRNHQRNAPGSRNVQEFVGAMRVGMRSEHTGDDKLRLREFLAEHCHERDAAAFSHIGWRRPKSDLGAARERLLEPR